MPGCKVLGIDMGGTNIRLGLVEEENGLSHFEIVKTQEILVGETPIEHLVELVQNYCERNLTGKMPGAISIGFPSTVDKTRRIVNSTPNIKGLDNLPVAQIMEQKLNIPVYINRDVNFLFLFDIADHAMENKEIVIGFYIGTGFGNAISIGGKLLLGKNGVAAELGHIPMFGVTLRCGCGNIGCAETVASGLRLEEIQKQFPQTPIHQMFAEHADEPVMVEFVKALALPIATEVNIFDPDCIILGGGILQMPGFPTARLEQFVFENARKPYPAQGLEIVYSRPNQQNGVIGAGIYAFKRMENEDYI